MRLLTFLDCGVFSLFYPITLPYLSLSIYRASDLGPPECFSHAGEVRHAYHRHHGASSSLAARRAAPLAARRAARRGLL